MPNNRGGVPMYNENAQYNATINPQVPQGSPASFGTQVAKEMAGMGDTIGKWGTNLVDYAIKRQEQDDDNYIMRRENDMRKALNDLLYNPQTGLANQKGHNADGVTLTFDDAADKLTQQFMSDVNNPVLQNKFQARVAQWLPGYRKGIAVHEGNEIFSAHKLDIDTSIQDKIDDALRAPNASSVGVLYASLGQNVADLMNILGMSREAAAEYVQEKYSGGVLQVAEAISGRGDTQGLLDLQKETNGKVSAGTQSKLFAMTGKVQAQMKGIDIAKQYRNNPKYLNPDGTFNAVLALQDYEKEHGKGSTRTERIWVDGGSIAYFSDSALNGDISAAAQEFNVDPALVAAVAQQESNGRQSAVSPVGALGVMQLMPDTATGLGVDPSNQKDNIRGGAKYLKQMLDRYNGDIDKALAAYNAGPRAVDEYGGIPPYKETQKYVNAVKGYYEQNKQKKGQSVNISNHTFYTVKPGKESEVEGLTHDTWVKLQGLAAAYERQFGGEADYEPFFVTAGGSQSGHNSGSKHYSGNAFDIAMDSLKRNPERFAWLEENAPKYGLKPLNEYNGYGNEQWADGENFHFSNDGTAIDEKKIYAETSKGGHYEERTVSNYNEQEYNEGLKWLKEQGEFSKAEHDQVFNNALNDALAKAKSLRMPSEVDALAHSYGLSETDAKRLYNVLLGARVDLADENQRYSEDQKSRTLRKQAEEDAADAFYAWWNANPNASDIDIRTKAADYGVGARFMHSLNSTIAKAAKNGGNSWFKNPYNKNIFNNAIRQNGLKGEQISNAMDIVTQKEAEKGSPLTSDEITTIVNKASAETVIYEGKWYERNVSGRAVDYPGGVIGKDRNGIDVTNEDGQNIVTGVDEEDFE